jgi:ribose 5-phosphate isomerase RpiB
MGTSCRCQLENKAERALGKREHRESRGQIKGGKQIRRSIIDIYIILWVFNKESQREPTRDYSDKRTTIQEDIHKYICVVEIFICGVGVGINVTKQR